MATHETTSGTTGQYARSRLDRCHCCVDGPGQRSSGGQSWSGEGGADGTCLDAERLRAVVVLPVRPAGRTGRSGRVHVGETAPEDRWATPAAEHHVAART